MMKHLHASAGIIANITDMWAAIVLRVLSAIEGMLKGREDTGLKSVPIPNTRSIDRNYRTGTKKPLRQCQQGLNLVTNGATTLFDAFGNTNSIQRSSSHFGDFNATSTHLATISHL